MVMKDNTVKCMWFSGIRIFLLFWMRSYYDNCIMSEIGLSLTCNWFLLLLLLMITSMASSTALICDSEAWKDLKVVLRISLFFSLSMVTVSESEGLRCDLGIVWCFSNFRRGMWKILRRPICVIWWVMLTDASRWWCMSSFNFFWSKCR